MKDAEPTAPGAVALEPHRFIHSIMKWISFHCISTRDLIYFWREKNARAADTFFLALNIMFLSKRLSKCMEENCEHIIWRDFVPTLGCHVVFYLTFTYTMTIMSRAPLRTSDVISDG